MPRLGSARWFVNAFNDLTTDRPVGMDVGNIPWSVIAKYADRYDLGDDFVDAIQQLDAIYLKEQKRGKSAPSKDRVPTKLVQTS